MKKMLAILLFPAFLWCCQSGTPGEATNEEEVIEHIENTGIRVDIARAIRTTFQKQLIANGTIEALQKSDLRFKISERLAGIQVRNGNWIQEGQVLAHLDNDLLKNQVEKAEIDLRKAKNKLQEEMINYGLETGQDTLDDPEVWKNLRIKSGVLEAENALEHTRLQLEQTFLKAPFAGVIANLETNIGNFISISDVFCTIINPHLLEVDFFIMESEFDLVNKGRRVSIMPFNNPGRQYEGTITEINPFVDKNGMIRIKAGISSQAKSLFDGLHVKVVINHPIPEVVVIPKEAVVMRSNREVVFTLENGMAKWNYVEIIDENSNSYAVRDGVTEQDTLIISGNLNLSHQAKVNINPDQLVKNELR